MGSPYSGISITGNLLERQILHPASMSITTRPIESEIPGAAQKSVFDHPGRMILAARPMSFLTWSHAQPPNCIPTYIYSLFLQKSQCDFPKCQSQLITLIKNFYSKLLVRKHCIYTKSEVLTLTCKALGHLPPVCYSPYCATSPLSATCQEHWLPAMGCAKPASLVLILLVPGA